MSTLFFQPGIHLGAMPQKAKKPVAPAKPVPTIIPTEPAKVTTQTATDAAVLNRETKIDAANVKAGQTPAATLANLAQASVTAHNAGIDAANAAAAKNKVKAVSIGLAILGLLKYL